jgi:hypothetical protein
LQLFATPVIFIAIKTNKMENSNQPLFNNKAVLPNSTAVLVLGICSIVFSCLFVGLILGIIGLVLSKPGRQMYKQNPGMYDGYGQLNAGYIMSIIGTCLGGLYVLYVIIWVVIIGTGSASIWQMNQ